MARPGVREATAWTVRTSTHRTQPPVPHRPASRDRAPDDDVARPLPFGSLPGVRSELHHVPEEVLWQEEGIEEHLTYSIQFLQLAEEQMTGPLPATDIPPRLLAYIADFDAGLKHDEYNSPRYAY